MKEEKNAAREEERIAPVHVCTCKVTKLLDHDELEVHRTILSLLPYIDSPVRLQEDGIVVAELEGSALHDCPHSYMIGLTWYCANPSRKPQIGDGSPE
jgi:hypothetical protein